MHALCVIRYVTGYAAYIVESAMCLLFLVAFWMVEFAFVSVRPALGLKLCRDR